MISVVLVVEDEPVVRMGAVAIAKEAADKVYEARNADEAIRVLETHSDVTLVFTDIEMPGSLNGLELAELVHRRWPAIRLIVTSGRIIVHDIDVPDDGRFIGKPYSAEIVRAAIQDAHDQLSG